MRGGYRYSYSRYYPGYWGPWGWAGWGWGFSPWYYQPYGYPYPYYYYGRMSASVKVQVQPKTAEVYVDGSLAGMVDDFDGFFQSLPVEPGGREIAVYKEGFRTYIERLYLRPGQSYKIRYNLEPLAAGEANELRPAPAAGSQYQLQQQQPLPRDPDQAGPPEPPAGGFEPQPQPESRAAAPSNFGQLAVRVQPADADVIIDDEPWRGPQGAERLVVYLKPGVHRVEIRKEGFDPFVTSVEVKKGETAVLNVSLGKLAGV